MWHVGFETSRCVHHCQGSQYSAVLQGSVVLLLTRILKYLCSLPRPPILAEWRHLYLHPSSPTQTNVVHLSGFEANIICNGSHRTMNLAPGHIFRGDVLICTLLSNNHPIDAVWSLSWILQ